MQIFSMNVHNITSFCSDSSYNKTGSARPEFPIFQIFQKKNCVLPLECTIILILLKCLHFKNSIEEIDMGNKNERQSRLLTLLRENESLTVRELAEQCSVSEMTIRRDLDTLKAHHFIDRSYGKATIRRSGDRFPLMDNYELNFEKIKMNEEKDRIGKFAAGMIEPGDVLIIDTGSTTDKLAKYLPDGMDITVLCYTYNILSQVIGKKNVRLIFSGGYYHSQSQLFECPQGIDLIKNIRATKLFLSAHGIHEKLGITCAQAYEVPIKRTALQSAQTKILIADSSKFGKVKTAYFAQLDEVDEIVTDSGISEEWREIIRGIGIPLHIV